MIPVILSSITAIAAIIAPIITQLIAQRSAYKLKTLELFAKEKIDVYKNFIAASADFFAESSNANAFKLAQALNQAILFSSKKTANYLRAYYRQLINFDLHHMDKFMEIQDMAISCIKDEIDNYHHYYRRSK